MCASRSGPNGDQVSQLGAALALAALDRVLAEESELRELWADVDDDAWMEGVQDPPPHEVAPMTADLAPCRPPTFRDGLAASDRAVSVSLNDRSGSTVAGMTDSDYPWEPPFAGTEVEHLVGALDRAPFLPLEGWRPRARPGCGPASVLRR